MNHALSATRARRRQSPSSTIRAWSSASSGSASTGASSRRARRASAGQRLGRHERQVGDRGQPAARVALGLGVGAQLLEVHGADAGLLAQLALGGLLGRLLRADEAARQREHPALGLLEPAREQHGEPAVEQGEHDGVGGQPDRRRVARVVGRLDRGHRRRWARRSGCSRRTAASERGAWPAIRSHGVADASRGCRRRSRRRRSPSPRSRSRARRWGGATRAPLERLALVADLAAGGLGEDRGGLREAERRGAGHVVGAAGVAVRAPPAPRPPRRRRRRGRRTRRAPPPPGRGSRPPRERTGARTRRTCTSAGTCAPPGGPDALLRRGVVARERERRVSGRRP